MEPFLQFSCSSSCSSVLCTCFLPPCEVRACAVCSPALPWHPPWAILSGVGQQPDSCPAISQLWAGAWPASHPHPLLPLPGSSSPLAGCLAPWLKTSEYPSTAACPSPSCRAQARAACGEGRQAGSAEKRAGWRPAVPSSARTGATGNAPRTTRAGRTETNQGVFQRGKASEQDAPQTIGSGWGAC